MFKWLFITSLTYVTVIESIDDESMTFNAQETILAECIKYQLIKVDSQYNSTQTAIDIVDLAARRFYGKTLSRRTFLIRFKDFIHQLRSKKICHEISMGQLNERLRLALREALIICGNPSSFTNLKKEKVKEVKIQSKEWISFSSNKFSLSRCIERHLKLTHHREFQFNDGFLEFIADCAARRYYGKSLLKNSFYQRNKYFFRDLRTKKVSHNVSTAKLSDEIELLVKQVVEDCATDQIPLVPVPTFEIEFFETAHLLNLILVKWPTDLYHMIQSQEGRAVLRRYASDALTVLLRELSVCQYNTQLFRVTIRLLWNNRAQKMYDGNSVELPYIKHRYTSIYPTPHMALSNFDQLIDRNSRDFSDRNPVVPASNLYKILNIHVPDRINPSGMADIFDSYRNNGMTSAEYYFENQINQFYRIIFFFMELQAAGICTDEDDFYVDALPNGLVAEQIKAIIYDDDIYRNYLSNERLLYVRLVSNSNTDNEIAQKLIESARVLEENLILLKSNIPSTSGVQSSCGSVTTSKPTSTTTQSLKRKNDVWKNEKGKCFLKRMKATASFDSYCIVRNLDTKISDEVTKPPFQKNQSFFVRDSIDHDSSMSFFDDCGASMKQEQISTDLSDEVYKIDASQKQDRIETNYLYGYMMFSTDDSKQLQFSHEDVKVFQNKSC